MTPVPENPRPFEGFELSKVAVIREVSDSIDALNYLMTWTHIGFDTETRPTFQEKVKAINDPHLVQLCTTEQAFLFQMGSNFVAGTVASILTSPYVVKVGFGIADDVRRLRESFGIIAKNLIDVQSLLIGPCGRRPSLKLSVERVLGQHLRKPKKITTSNWLLPELSPQQREYAANDALAPLLIHSRLERTI